MENIDYASKLGNNLTVKNRREALERRFPKWQRQTVATHFSDMCTRFRERPFIYLEETRLTYNEVWENAVKYAKGFLKLGVKRRDHIAILMDNDTDYPSLMIAASMVGAVFIPLNTMLSKDELAYILNQSDSRYLLMHEKIKGNNYREIVSELLEDKQLAEQSKLTKVVCINADKTKGMSKEQFLSWDDFSLDVESISNADLEERRITSEYPDEIAMIMYTSGSTGKPKGVMLTHDQLLRCSYSTCLSRAIEDGRVTFAPLPFYHCFAIVEGIFAMSFVGGALISASRFSPLSALEKMEKHKANDFLCVPSMLVPLLNEPRLSEFDLSDLFAMWCGAAPAPVYVWEQAIEKLGVTEIITGYGQTEVTSSGVTTEIGDPLERITSHVGRPKLGGVSGLTEFNGSNVQYKTIDPETRIDLPDGSIGELAVRGNTVAKGYYNKPEETSDAIDKDGWLRTGDVGVIDEFGYIQHQGRSNDLYKVSGELVAPKETEEAIAKHPAVNQVFIVGVPDPMTTETGFAFIELKAGESCVRKDITDWCSERISRFKIPRHVWFIENADLPMTSTGKVQNFRLQEIAKEKLKKN